MHDLTVPLLDEFVKLRGLIEEAQFDHGATEPDTILWTRTASGEYSARSAYDMQFEGGALSSFPKTVWKVWAPFRCKFFMWLLLQNRVWTVDILLLREWLNSYFCPMCYRSLETAHHLFAECPATSSIWRAVSSWSGCASPHPDAWNEDADLVGWFFDLAGSAMDAATKGTHSLAILVVCLIWCDRNNRIFNNLEKPIAKLVDDIRDATRPWCVAGANHLAALVDRLIRE